MFELSFGFGITSIVFQVINMVLLILFSCYPDPRAGYVIAMVLTAFSIACSIAALAALDTALDSPEATKQASDKALRRIDHVISDDEFPA